MQMEETESFAANHNKYFVFLYKQVHLHSSSCSIQ